MKRSKLVDKEGNKLPSISHILDENYGWNKNILLNWYYKEFKAGNDPREKTKKAKSVGNLCHDFIFWFESNEKPDNKKLSTYSTEAITIAESGLDQYKIIKKENNIVILLKEETLVSEKYKYGGRLDLYGTVNEFKSLIDTKTSPRIYQDHLIQVSGYDNLLIENDYKVQKRYILHIDKNPLTPYDQIVHLKPIDDILVVKGFEIFRCLLWLNNQKESFKYE